ncbi:MAG: hypothetical protein IIB72_07195 [Proteobacteria bacterium]|nr:hypothetical protein [Pseudomonadota bacterium]
MPEQVTIEEALERVLTMALEMPSAELKAECERRAKELASVMDEDTVSRIKAKVKRTIH